MKLITKRLKRVPIWKSDVYSFGICLHTECRCVIIEYIIRSAKMGVLIVNRKNRILVSILILMGAAMLSSCTSAADAGAAGAASAVASVAVEYEAV